MLKGDGCQKVHAYFFNGPSNIDLKTLHLVIDDYESIPDS